MSAGGLTKRMGQALLDVVQVYVDSGHAPSTNIQLAALRILRKGDSRRIPGNWHLYEIPGEHDQVYTVALRGERRRNAGFTVTRALCGCEAGKHGTTCKHAIVAMTLAAEQGHFIDPDLDAQKRSV